MSKQLSIVVLLSVFWLVGCAAHERDGDRAAALGDWKTALREYRAALSNEPESPKLKEKYQQARHEAALSAFRHAQSCAAMQDWNCALTEADSALQIDDGNTEIATFRASAALSLARAHLQAAREATERGDFQRAFERLERATVVSKQPEILQEAGLVKQELAGRAEAEAERLHQAKAYPRALEVLKVLVAVDSTKQPTLEAIQREYDEYLTAEYERLAQEGDTSLGAHDWATARDRYAAALQLKHGGRAESLLRYTEATAAGEAALSRRDFAAATRAYQAALKTGEDRDGYASRQWEAVVIRPYAVRVRAVLAKPMRPDGRPWVGPPNKFMTKVVSLAVGGAATYTFGPLAGKVGKDLAKAYMEIPPENRPNLRVRATLPDDSMLLTPSKNGLYVVYDSEFVIATNHFDERRLSFHVVHEGSTVDDVGVIDVNLKDLVANRDAALSNQSIELLQLSAEPAPDKADGMFSEMRPPRDSENGAAADSLPSPTSKGFRLKAVRVGIRRGDYKDELGLDGAPDPYVEILQHGKVIYRSPKVQDAYDASWEPRSVSVYVEGSEQLTVRAWDADATEDDLAFAYEVPAKALARGLFQASTPKGSYIRLEFEPKRGPGLDVASAR